MRTDCLSSSPHEPLPQFPIDAPRMIAGMATHCNMLSGTHQLLVEGPGDGRYREESVGRINEEVPVAAVLEKGV